MQKAYNGDQYSAAFKQATIDLSCFTSNDETRGRGGSGAPAVEDKFNESMLSSPSDLKIKPTALCDAILSNRVGLSSAKRGCPKKVSSALCATLAAQSVMMQASGKGEASSVRIKALMNGLVSLTKNGTARSAQNIADGFTAEPSRDS